MSYLLEGDDPADFLSYRVNLVSKGRALVMLFLFSDVGQDDAPTRIRAGSHGDIARTLAAFGDKGASLRELAADGFARTGHRREMLATGSAGTVYLCHPFLVHAAQPHRGTTVKFMAQPPLLPRHGFDLTKPLPRQSPVGQAITRALSDPHP